MYIAVLLSTYNGENYLRIQLDSILSQTNKAIRVYIRDDGSTDSTLAIIEEYAKRYPSRITFLQDSSRNLGPAKSFMKLLVEVKADYYFFCDQDDKWKEDKVERTLSFLQKIEDENPGKPVLVHTDAEIVDQNLKPLYHSLWKRMRVHPKRLDNKWMTAVCYTITGCTMAINNAAKQVSIPMPSNAHMHDHWIAYKVSLMGKVRPLNYASMLYRQHQSNAVGITETGTKERINKLTSLNHTIYSYYAIAKFHSKNGYGSIMKWFFFKMVFFIIR